MKIKPEFIVCAVRLLCWSVKGAKITTKLPIELWPLWWQMNWCVNLPLLAKLGNKVSSHQFFFSVFVVCSMNVNISNNPLIVFIILLIYCWMLDLDAVRQNVKGSVASDKEIEKAVDYWLRKASNRIKKRYVTWIAFIVI